jgi:hypothetical protein
MLQDAAAFCEMRNVLWLIDWSSDCYAGWQMGESEHQWRQSKEESKEH